MLSCCNVQKNSSHRACKIFTILMAAYFLLFTGLHLASASQYINLLAMICLAPYLCHSWDSVSAQIGFIAHWCLVGAEGPVQGRRLLQCRLCRAACDQKAQVRHAWFGVYHSHLLFTLTMLLNRNCHPNSSAKGRLWKCPQNSISRVYLDLIQSMGVGTVIFIFIFLFA